MVSNIDSNSDEVVGHVDIPDKRFEININSVMDVEYNWKLSFGFNPANIDIGLVTAALAWAEKQIAAKVCVPRDEDGEYSEYAGELEYSTQLVIVFGAKGWVYALGCAPPETPPMVTLTHLTAVRLHVERTNMQAVVMSAIEAYNQAKMAEAMQQRVVEGLSARGVPDMRKPVDLQVRRR